MTIEQLIANTFFSTPWSVAGILFAMVIAGCGSIPFARDFRIAAVSFAIVGLFAGAVHRDLQWHLLWYTPLTIAAAYFYALRRLFWLSHRIRNLGRQGISSPEEMKRALKEEVDKFNEGLEEKDRMK